MAEVIAIANQKGGVGKTTTTLNLAVAVAQLGYESLLVDMDPQANATSGLGLDKRTVQPTIYPILLKQETIGTAIHRSPVEFLDIVPANRDLTGAEIELVSALARENRLKSALLTVKPSYKFIFVDCPPSLGLLTLNAFTAADRILVPVQSEYYALEGLAQLLETIQKVQRALNPRLQLEGAVLTMYDARMSLNNQVRAEVEKYFKEKTFSTTIPRNIRLAEAPSFGQPIFQYDPRSKGAEAYLELAKEFLARRGTGVKDAGDTLGAMAVPSPT